MKNNDLNGEFTGPAEVRLVRTLPGPIERTSPTRKSAAAGLRAAQWSCARAASSRSIFTTKTSLQTRRPPEEHKQHHDAGHDMAGVVTRCEPPRLIAFTFGSTGESEATFELTPQGRNVLLVLTHRARGEDVPYMAEFGAGGHTHLTHLVALLEEASPPPFWPVHAKLKAIYEKLRIAAQSSLKVPICHRFSITPFMKTNAIENSKIVSPEEWLASLGRRRNPGAKGAHREALQAPRGRPPAGA